MDNAAMLAKLTAELASVSQASQQNGNATGLLFQNGLSLGGQAGQFGVRDLNKGMIMFHQILMFKFCFIVV